MTPRWSGWWGEKGQRVPLERCCPNYKIAIRCHDSEDQGSYLYHRGNLLSCVCPCIEVPWRVDVAVKILLFIILGGGGLKFRPLCPGNEPSLTVG